MNNCKPCPFDKWAWFFYANRTGRKSQNNHIFREMIDISREIIDIRRMAIDISFEMNDICPEMIDISCAANERAIPSCKYNPNGSVLLLFKRWNCCFVVVLF